MNTFTWALRPCIRQAGIVSSSIRASRPPSYSVFRITQSCPVVTRHASSKSSTPPQNASPAAVENTNVDHSSFIAEASPQQEWKKENPAHKAIPDPAAEEQDAFNTITPGKGKLSPTSSHLFKLIIPLGHLSGQLAAGRSSTANPAPPTVFLLHPTQPLSHVARLIAASLAPAQPTIAFRSSSKSGKSVQWSDATDVSDFVKDAAQANEFIVNIARAGAVNPTPSASGTPTQEGDTETQISVEVPTFADRTRFLRRRLEVVGQEMKEMEGLKNMCDREAHRSARRLAVTGFGLLVAYWGTVTRLTFWDLGWDIMEPVTYLSGLSMVIASYFWFLYQGREVSYSSVLDRSINNKRNQLYEKRGFDVERWDDLVAEARQVRREISKIAQDYDKWKGDPKAEEAEAAMRGADGENENKEGEDVHVGGDPDNVEGGPGESDGDKVVKDAKRTVPK